MGNSKLIMFTLFVVLFVLLIIIFGRGFHKDSKMKPKYDERQMLIRGRGYMIAFYTIIIVSCFIPILATEEVKTFLGDLIYFIPLLIGIPVHITYCIWNNAYLELNLNYKRWIGYMFFVSAFNLMVGIWAILDGRFIKDGVLQPNAINLFLSILLIVVIIEILIKNAIDRKEADEDEESEA